MGRHDLVHHGHPRDERAPQLDGLAHRVAIGRDAAGEKHIPAAVHGNRHGGHRPVDRAAHVEDVAGVELGREVLPFVRRAQPDLVGRDELDILAADEARRVGWAQHLAVHRVEPPHRGEGDRDGIPYPQLRRPRRRRRVGAIDLDRRPQDLAHQRRPVPNVRHLVGSAADAHAGVLDLAVVLEVAERERDQVWRGPHRAEDVGDPSVQARGVLPLRELVVGGLELGVSRGRVRSTRRQKQARAHPQEGNSHRDSDHEERPGGVDDHVERPRHAAEERHAGLVHRRHVAVLRHLAVVDARRRRPRRKPPHQELEDVVHFVAFPHLRLDGVGDDGDDGHA